MPTTVLVVDDDELTQEMLRATLEAEHAVALAANADDMLSRCAAQDFDLVVLDVDMPGRNGYEACRALKEHGGRNAATPVLFHSALTGVEERLRGFEAGGEDYLAKPFEPLVLLAKVRLLIGAQQRQRELSGQLDEAMQAALTTADMIGETGVVLDFQRSASQSRDARELAQALHEALQRFGLEGVVRLHSREALLDLNARGAASALETSLLDHLAAQGSEPRVRAIGPHAGFHWGRVMLFVRGLSVAREGLSGEEADRIGRVLDNLALLLEGASLRLVALDGQHAVRDLDGLRAVIGQTQEALADISALGHAQQLAVAGHCESLSALLEQRFMHLGLTHEQEEQLADMVDRHRQAVLAELNKQQALEQRLSEVIAGLRAQL
jgi:DNA-binding response OmpR family regulator